MTDNNILRLNYSGEILLFDFRLNGKNIAQFKEINDKKEGIYIIFN